MKATHGEFEGSFQVKEVVENDDATWTIRIQSLTSGIYLPDMIVKKLPELFVGAKGNIEPKFTPIGG